MIFFQFCQQRPTSKTVIIKRSLKSSVVILIIGREVTYTKFLLLLEHFFTLWHYKMFQMNIVFYSLHFQNLPSLEIPGSLYLKTVFINQDTGVVLIVFTGMSLILSPLSKESQEIMCHTTLCIDACLQLFLFIHLY